MNKDLKYYIFHNDKAYDDVKTLVNKRHGIILDLLESTDMDKFEMNDNGEYEWNENRYNNIFKNMAKNTCLVVQKKEFVANSSFYNETIMPASKDKLVPLKNKNCKPMPTESYGGYTNDNPAFFVVLKTVKNNKKEERVEYKFDKVPLRIAYMEKQEKNAIDNYFKEQYPKMNRVEVIKKIYFNQKIKFNGQLCRIRGVSEQQNAYELCINSKYEELLYLVEKASDKEPNKFAIKILEDYYDYYNELIKQFIIDYCSIIEKELPLYKEFVNKLKTLINGRFNDNCADDKKQDLEFKTECVKQMLQISGVGFGRVDKFIGGGGSSRLTKTLGDLENIVWIDESCTGLYQKISKGVSNWDGEK